MRPLTAAVVFLMISLSSSLRAADTSPEQTAAKVDGLILSGSASTDLALIDDAAFLRRVSFDLIGRPPTAAEVTFFGLNPDPRKRHQIVKQMLSSADYAKNWSRYWRDVVLLPATNARASLVQPIFEGWLQESFSANRPWDAMVSELLTATGTVREDGATALMFAHEGEPEEIAAEASRLFLGIQIQCANCHDHPWDGWKREQFHEFAAFFPRVSVRRERGSDRPFDYEVASMDVDRRRTQGISQFLLSRLDRNRDQFLSEDEAKNSALARIFTDQIKTVVDKDGDGRLSLEEVRTARPPENNRPGQGSAEHFMPDLSDPSSDGALIHPAFFVGDVSVDQNLKDVARREAAADLMTSADNPWFARAIVNRLWYELTSTAFYLPIDDLGPDRAAEHADALQVLCDGFVASGHDLQWLLQTITATQLYQRAINAEAEGFVRLEPQRLRADQLYDAVCQTLNVTSLPLPFTSGRINPYARDMDRGRMQFASTFGFDPSKPRSDLAGSIPEALFLMNSKPLHSLVQADSANSTIAQISRKVLTDEEVLSELYLTAVSREPTDREVAIGMEYILQAPSRMQAFEDLLWALLNSSEFQSKG